MKPHLDENLTEFERKVVVCARAGERTVEDIAREIGARVNSVSAARDRLQRKGVVAPHFDWADPIVLPPLRKSQGEPGK